MLPQRNRKQRALSSQIALACLLVLNTIPPSDARQESDREPSRKPLQTQQDNGAQNAIPVRRTRVGIADIRRIVPDRTDVPRREILKATERPPAPIRRWDDPSITPLPNIIFQAGEPVRLGPDGAIEPRGIRLISGQITVRSADGKSFAGEKEIWRWEPPEALKQAFMFLHRTVDPMDPLEKALRFRPLVLILDDAKRPEQATLRLLLFDAERGKVWERDIKPLFFAPDPFQPERQALLGVKSVNTTLDGAYTILSLAPQITTPTTGSRLLVFDARGNLVAQTELDGMGASGVRRTPDGYHFLLTAGVYYREGKPFPRPYSTALMLLSREGTIQGAFVGARDELYADWLLFSEDKKLAAFLERGVTYDMTPFALTKAQKKQ